MIYLDDVLLDNLENVCSTFNGELKENNTKACLIQKDVKGKVNYVLLVNDILDDDINKIDRVEVYYK